MLRQKLGHRSWPSHEPSAGAASKQVSEEELHRLIGIFMINSLEVELGPGHGEEMGFYPVFSNINHSCLANARLVKLPDKSIEVCAKVAIKEGEEVTNCYLRTSLTPTMSRRKLLRTKWFFDCVCQRCQDPTELNSHLSSQRCRAAHQR